MNLTFTKMHGLGNDFVVIDAINQSVSLSDEQLRLLADRRFGVGCDQVLVVEAPRTTGVDFTYRIYNTGPGGKPGCTDRGVTPYRSAFHPVRYGSRDRNGSRAWSVLP